MFYYHNQLKYLFRTLDRQVVIDDIVQTLSNLRYFLKALKFGILSQYRSLVQQAFLLLRKRD